MHRLDEEIAQRAQKELGFLERNPSEAVWMRIQRDMQAQKRIRMYRRMTWLAAACLGAVLVSGAWFLWETGNAPHYQAQGSFVVQEVEEPLKTNAQMDRNLAALERRQQPAKQKVVGIQQSGGNDARLYAQAPDKLAHKSPVSVEEQSAKPQVVASDEEIGSAPTEQKSLAQLSPEEILGLMAQAAQQDPSLLQANNKSTGAQSPSGAQVRVLHATRPTDLAVIASEQLNRITRAVEVKKEQDGSMAYQMNLGWFAVESKRR